MFGFEDLKRKKKGGGNLSVETSEVDLISYEEQLFDRLQVSPDISY